MEHEAAFDEVLQASSVLVIDARHGDRLWNLRAGEARLIFVRNELRLAQGDFDGRFGNRPLARGCFNFASKPSHHRSDGLVGQGAARSELAAD